MDTTKKFKLEHFAKRIDEIYENVFSEHLAIDEFLSFEEKDDLTNGSVLPKGVSWKKFTNKDRWIAHDKNLWLKTNIAIPKEWKEKQVAINIKAFAYNIKTFEPKWMGFEGILFINGKAYKGISDNHPMVYIPKNLTGTEIEISMRIWSGTDAASLDRPFALEFRNVILGVVDENALEFSMLAKAALQTVNQLDETNPYHPELYNTLDSTFKKIDFSHVGGNDFRNSVKNAFDYMSVKIDALSKKSYHSASDYAMGHAHLDVAWLWRVHQLTEKTARTWLTALRWMDMDKDFTFIQTQPQLYADIKKYYPDMYAEIKKRVKEGRWCVEGSMWVEADCNLSSGEALSRQMLYGKRFFKEEFGVDTKTLWLPDVFGYSYALPQILKLAEVQTFITSKISWNQYNRFPHDVFFWRGMDGSDILTAFIVIPEPKPRNNWYYTYNGMMTAEVINDAWQAFSDKDACGIFVHPYGFGDGGGGPTFEQVKIKNHLKKMPGIPKLKDGTLYEFNQDLHKITSKNKEKFALYSGELYLEYHRGTYTSQALVKKNNRKFELALAHLENMFAISLIKNKNICDKEKMRGYWHTLLKNQFHDILPGSSIHNVYEDSKKEFEKMGEDIEKDREKIFSSISQKSADCLTVYNPLLHERKDIIEIEDVNTTALQTPEGEILFGQKVGNKTLFETQTPSLGYTTLKKVQTANSSEKLFFTLSEKSIKTKFYKFSWNNLGQINSIVLLENGLELVEKNKCMNVFELLEDKPRQYDAWEFEPYAEEKTDIVTEFLGVKKISLGHIACVLNFSYKYKDSIISQDVVFYAKSPKIDFKTKVVWNEREKILRAAFYGNIIANKATYDIQYGNVERPTHRNTSWDVARFEVVAHRWADIGDRNLGFSVLNDCKYGYSALHNCLRITLLKGSNIPDYSADLGEHEFTYSLLPHSGTWVDAETNKHASELNCPLQVIKGIKFDKDKESFITNEGSANIEIDAFKIAEDTNEIVVRLHEYGGMHSNVSLGTGFNVKEWQIVNILENPLAQKVSGKIEFDIKPYEIITLKIFR